jgi:ribosomal protein S18 acetylase RimI-like enzyme
MGMDLEEVRAGSEAEVALAMGAGSSGEVAARLGSGRRCFALRADGAVGAYGWMTPGPEWIGELDRRVGLARDEAYLWDCATLPAHRRRGLYKALLAEMLLVLSLEGCRRAWIGAALSNRPSVRAFSALGFRPVVMVDYRRVGPASCFLATAFAGADPASVAYARTALAAPAEHVFGGLRLGWGLHRPDRDRSGP